jgi:hypothetical protein
VTGAPSPSPAQGEAKKRPERSVGIVVAPFLALALSCGPGGEQAVVPARSDLAQTSRGVLPGTTYEHREKIKQGMKSEEVSAAIGKPSEKLESRGQIVSGHWTYLFKDGKITMHLRDGVVTDIETTFY